MLLGAHPKVRLQFTPTYSSYSSWSDKVELVCAKMGRGIVDRGVHLGREAMPQDPAPHSSLQYRCDPLHWSCAAPMRRIA